MATMSRATAERKCKAAKKKGKSGIVIRRPGAFTAWCKAHGHSSVTSACIQQGLKSKSTRVRRMANFARNARKFKKGGKRK